MVLSTVTKLYSHHQYLIPEHSITPERQPMPIGNPSLSLFLPALDKDNHKSTFALMGLPIVDTLYKQDYIIYKLFICLLC